MTIEVTYLSEAERTFDGEYVVTADGAPLESIGLKDLPDALQVWRTADRQHTFGVMFWDAGQAPLIVEILSGWPRKSIDVS